MTGSDRQPRARRDDVLRAGTAGSGLHAPGAREAAYASDRRQESGGSGGVALLERPTGGAGSTDFYSDFDAFGGELDFSADPRITAQDVRTALGEDTDTLLAQADVDVDELIRLIGAETTLLPAIRIPDEPETAGEGAAAGQAEDADDSGKVLSASAKTWKKRFLKGAALSVLITLTGGGAAALAMDKSVTIEVDGKERTVHSYGDTVGEVLDDVGLQVGAHDALSPSPQAEVGDGAVIHLERGRHLNVIVDGEKRESWVRATTVGEALDQLGMNELVAQKGTKLSAPASGQIPLDGMTLKVKTLKHITLFNGGGEPKQLTTHAVTTQALLDQLGISLGPDDAVMEGMDFKLTDGAEVHITRTGVTVIKEKETIEPPVTEIEDPNLMQGKRVVKEEGTPGKELVTYEVTMRNNKEVAREEVNSKVLTKPEPKVVRVGTKQPPQPNITNGAVWDQLAQCESGGNWHANTGNGYYGGLQFGDSTWDAYGGEQYAPRADQASRAQQIAIASKVRDRRGGYGAWPMCSSKLGLPK